MKIQKGKISKKKLNQGELEFRKKLKKALKTWFDLKLKDIPQIVKKIGLESEEYELEYISDDYSHLNFKVKTKNDELEVELFRGDMVNPYSQCKVSKDGKEEIYSLLRIVQVEKIAQKPETSPEYKKIMGEADEKIRQDRIRQAKAVRKAKDCIAL